MSAFSVCAHLGMGFVGLPTSPVFVDNRFTVIGVDVDQSIVDRINTAVALAG